MKLHITADGEGAHRAFDSQHDVARCVLDDVRGFAYGPLLLYGADHRAGGRRHLHALQPARAPARVAR